MDITNSFLNSIKNQGMGLPGATSSMQDTIQSMLTDINSRNKELKNNNGNYFSDLLKQTGAALLKNPNDGVLTAMGQGMQGVDQVQKERKNEQLQNQQQALELRTLLFNTHRAVAEFGEKQRHSRVKEDLSRMDIEMKIGKSQMDEEQKRQAALKKALEQGDKVFGSRAMRETEKGQLSEFKDLFKSGKHKTGFTRMPGFPLIGENMSSDFKIRNTELRNKQRFPESISSNEGVAHSNRKLEELDNRSKAQNRYEFLVKLGITPREAIEDAHKKYPFISDNSVETTDEADE